MEASFPKALVLVALSSYASVYCRVATEVRETTVEDPEVRQLLKTAAGSPLRRSEFSPLPRDGAIGVVRRGVRERTRHWADVDVSLAIMDERGSHEWNFALVDGNPRLVCESQAIYGPNTWVLAEGPSQERVILASGSGGACATGQGFRAVHLGSGGLRAVEPTVACERVRQWASKGQAGTGACDLTAPVR